MRKILEQVKGNDFENVRLILLTKSFVFNQKIKFIKRKRNQELREKLLVELAQQLKVPKGFIFVYADSKKIFLKDIEAQTSLYYVYDTAEGLKNIIDEDGIYIKFDPEKPDSDYTKLIKQLRSLYAFINSPDKDQQNFLSKKGSILNYLGDKKATTPRHQHGYNVQQDIRVYLTCENAIKDMFSTKSPVIKAAKEDNIKRGDAEKYLLDALGFAAEEVHLTPEQTKRIYYEVCRRYKLPTLTKDPFPYK